MDNKYVIATGYNRANLCEHFSRYIEKGWYPIGGMVIDYNDNEDENRRVREEVCLQVHNKIKEMNTLCPFVISKSTLEYHYGQEYIIQLNRIAINDLLDVLIKNHKKTIQVANEI